MNRNWVDKEKWCPADGFRLEAEAMDTVLNDKNTLVVAGPGAGKTELLAQRACFLLETNTCRYPKKILAISFKKDAADNLKERVELRCGKELASRFESKTYDAFAKEIEFKNIPVKYCSKLTPPPCAVFDFAYTPKDCISISDVPVCL